MGRRVKVPAGGPREEALLGALRLGNTRGAAAAVAEIDRTTLWRMLDDATFRNAVEKAEAARLAAPDGLDPDELLAEAERIVAR